MICPAMHCLSASPLSQTLDTRHKQDTCSEHSVAVLALLAVTGIDILDIPPAAAATVCSLSCV